jgi:BRCT domain type II-containing protein
MAKPVSKKAVKKSAKPVAKKSATKAKPVAKKSATKATKSATNKELDKMIAKVNEAKKNGEKSVVVFTTNKNSHKANTSSGGFGASDLKPKLYEAYKHMLVNYDVQTRPVSIPNMEIEWTVKIK